MHQLCTKSSSRKNARLAMFSTASPYSVKRTIGTCGIKVYLGLYKEPLTFRTVSLLSTTRMLLDIAVYCSAWHLSQL